MHELLSLSNQICHLQRCPAAVAPYADEEASTGRLLQQISDGKDVADLHLSLLHKLKLVKAASLLSGECQLVQLPCTWCPMSHVPHLSGRTLQVGGMSLFLHRCVCNLAAAVLYAKHMH